MKLTQAAGEVVLNELEAGLLKFLLAEGVQVGADKAMAQFNVGCPELAGLLRKIGFRIKGQPNPKAKAQLPPQVLIFAKTFPGAPVLPAGFDPSRN